MNLVYHQNALSVLGMTVDASVDMIYVDPPFGTGANQTLRRKKDGTIVSTVTFADPDRDYLLWLQPHVVEMRRVLKPTGTMYLHMDQRWSHYAKVMCDDVFGRACFLNEVVWSYNFGGRGKNCWPKKHDNILVYVKEAGQHIFNWDDVPRIPYEVPEMQKVGRSLEEAAARVKLGQVPTDVWKLSILGTASYERNGYPTQKPVKLVERAVLASSPVDGVIMDVFAGSGTTGAAALKHGRSFVLADVSPYAIEKMRERFKDVDVDWRT